MAYHCGAPTRDGSACERHVREQGRRCHQHRDLGGAALPTPRLAMRTLTLEDPALLAGPAGWMSAREEIARAHAEEWGEAMTSGKREESERERSEREDSEREAEAREAEAREAEARAVGTDAGAGAGAGADADADGDEPFWVPAPPHSRPSRILFGEKDDERPAVPERDAKLNELSQRETARSSLTDDGLPRRRWPRPEREDAPNEPALPDRRKARAIEDYLRRHEQGEEDGEGEGDEERARTPEVEAEAEAAGSDGQPETARQDVRPLFRDEVEPEPALETEPESEPEWIGARPLFRDEAPTLVQPRVEFQPAEDDLTPPPAPRRPPRIAPMRSVVLGTQPQPGSAPLTRPTAGSDRDPDPDPPTLVGLPDDVRDAVADPGPPTRAARPDAVADPDPPTLIGLPDDLAVPDFVVPGFAVPAPKPPLRTVLSSVLGPELWERCYAEWGPGHCISLARLARSVDGLAPSAAAALRSSAGASLRWLGVNRELEDLADQVAAAISHPVGASDPNRARTTRLYGAAICVALNIPMRRCACHRDLDRDVSGELIRLGLEELAGEVP